MSFFIDVASFSKEPSLLFTLHTQGWAMCYRWFGRGANLLFLLPLVLGIIVYRYLLITYLVDINFPPGARFACCVEQVSKYMYVTHFTKVLRHLVH